MTNTKHELLQSLGRLKLDTLLLHIADMIRAMYGQEKPIIKVPITYFDGPAVKKGNVTITAWDLSDLAYLAIKESDDFKIMEPSERDFLFLCNQFRAWETDLSRVEMDKHADEDFFLKFSIGASQKQFWYQERHRIHDEFNRQVELLEVIPSEVESKLDLESICKEVTGYDFKTFRTILMALYAIARTQSDLGAMGADDYSGLQPFITPQDVRKVANFYAGDYKEFRDSKFLENYFYVKPIVRTSNNHLLAVNVYMLAKKIADGPLWIIRNYYIERKSQDFVNEFGKYFEHYVKKLLKHCLPMKSFANVPRPNSGRHADLFIYTEHYRIIIELKSSILELMVRRPFPELDLVHKYLEKFQEGVLQLDSTEQNNPEPTKTTIKLLVHYETLYISDAMIRPLAVEAVRSQISSTEHIYFCDIGEFEWFITVLGQSESDAEKILAKKIDMESSPAAGREFGDIIPNVVDTKNFYAEKTLSHWEDSISMLQKMKTPKKSHRDSL